MHDTDDRSRRGPDGILRECAALGVARVTREPAKVRLEERLGPELTRRLVSSLTATGRR